MSGTTGKTASNAKRPGGLKLVTLGSRANPRSRYGKRDGRFNSQSRIRALLGHVCVKGAGLECAKA